MPQQFSGVCTARFPSFSHLIWFCRPSFLIFFVILPMTMGIGTGICGDFWSGWVPLNLRVRSSLWIFFRVSPHGAKFPVYLPLAYLLTFFVYWCVAIFFHSRMQLEMDYYQEAKKILGTEATKYLPNIYHFDSKCTGCLLRFVRCMVLPTWRM